MLILYMLLIIVADMYAIYTGKPEQTCGQNASYIECPSACPSTCKTPNERSCKKRCVPKGCHCNPSYILSKPRGQCILPDDCPGGNPCPQNETFVACSIGCPTNYCPVDDSLAILVCDPSLPCPSGCSCKPNYKRKSVKEPRCILAAECPPVKCTRPNEEWNPCTNSCLRENCYDLTTKNMACKPQGCEPRCACKNGYYRNDSGICVPESQCPPPPIKCGVNEEYSTCKIKCPPQFCNISYTDYGICPNDTKCEPGCNCIKDHLRDFEGKCVLNDNCPPPPSTCGGNATYTDCASSCPPTCQTPKPEVCAAVCKPNVKCKCKPSYVLSPNGDCILPQDCPAPPPVCGENEVSTICKTTCPSDSCDSEKQQAICKPGPCRPGCNCKKGYARDSNGKCIPKDQCPAKPIICGGNATLVDCTSACPLTCETPKSEVCIALCKPKGCQCKPSYVLSPKGDCILPQDCPAPTPCGGNATATDCASSCPPTCQTPKPEVCAAVCKPNVKCKCKPSYVLSPNGDCILPQDCPAPPPVCGENEVSTICKTTCPSDSCDSEKQQAICKPGPCRPGCNCKEGYARDSDGKCIPKEQCPKTPSPCGGNATYTDCASSCPPTCETPKPGVCIFGCKPNVTCQCKPSYVLSPNGDCILPKDCPAPICGGNATLVTCASSCPSTCQTPNPQSCIAQCNPNSCQCKSSYILSKPKGECISPVDCPGGSPCSQNETFVSCNIQCPNSYCPVDDRQGILICDPPRPCPSGCSCKLNYKRKSIKDPQCILAEECLPSKTCDIPDECKATCAEPNPKNCPYQSATENVEGCKCKPGFVLSDKNGECIRIEECPVPSKTCDIPDECKATCAEPNPKNCPYQSATENVEGCKCKPGFVLSDKNGECIRIEECPGKYRRDNKNQPIIHDLIPLGNKFDTPAKELGCNGDNNSIITKCPPPCPSTCQSPNEVLCKKSCLPVGCKCKDGFILSKLNGLCIKPDNCTGGNPCKNGAFSSCNSKCSYNYCPIDDSPPDYNCSAPSPCRSGCVCRFNYRKKSFSDDQCILASDCPTPPVVCGANEVKTCQLDDDYDTEVSVCKPTCVCKEKYSRDSNGNCVPDTPPCGDYLLLFTYHEFNLSKYFDAKAVYHTSKTCDVPPECRRTCAEPNPKNCSYQEVFKNKNGCKCKPGYILLDKDGKCVKIEDCPSDLSCNGDANALVSQCPSPCPSTCSAPNEILCKKACLDVGCKCKEGFILSKLNGLCIPPEKCKGGNPCGKNATFSSCSSRSSYNYCPKDDSPLIYNCAPPYRCPSGCVCNLNYRRKSIDDRQCILASECPPVNCTRPNEVWDSCPSDCLQERCEDAGKDPVPCNTFVLNCQPKCVCKANTFRNKDGICVPVNKCQEEKIKSGDKTSNY
ncbi:Tenascin-X [Papilio machaon]|uniref:Tenascin-X n=1 Tax=Papilio machaon TaxID=76193 RepID=A0A194QQM3_PAPMA|nr:Tenascin-X [Papilio machaon]